MRAPIPQTPTPPSPMPADTARAIDCRYAVRHHLAVRHPAALDAETIRLGIARGGGRYEPAEIASALALLAGLDPPQVESQKAGLGPSLVYWSATSAGVFADELGE